MMVKINRLSWSSNYYRFWVLTLSTQVKSQKLAIHMDVRLCLAWIWFPVAIVGLLLTNVQKGCGSCGHRWFSIWVTVSQLDHSPRSYKCTFDHLNFLISYYTKMFHLILRATVWPHNPIRTFQLILTKNSF